MAPTTLHRAVLLTTSVVLAVGVVDGIISREWDLLAVFAVALALQLLLLARLSGRRPAVPIRRDLVSWLRNQAALGGEPIEAVADRAISSYRAGFTDADRPSAASSTRDSVDPADPEPDGSR
jgi:hypothetical protein